MPDSYPYKCAFCGQDSPPVEGQGVPAPWKLIVTHWNSRLVWCGCDFETEEAIADDTD